EVVEREVLAREVVEREVLAREVVEREALAREGRELEVVEREVVASRSTGEARACARGGDGVGGGATVYRAAGARGKGTGRACGSGAAGTAADRSFRCGPGDDRRRDVCGPRAPVAHCARARVAQPPRRRHHRRPTSD